MEKDGESLADHFKLQTLMWESPSATDLVPWTSLFKGNKEEKRPAPRWRAVSSNWGGKTSQLL